MRSLPSICLFALIILCSFAKAQSFNYVHYDVKEGLAGSTVYDICQDRDGFLWAGTENGVSRFDGTSFRNFTVNDGLPDNEVLKTHADSKGRVWFGTFAKEVCYYYEGKIFKKDNDALLKNPLLKFQAIFIQEDRDGNVMITDYKKAVIITSENKVIDFLKQPEIKKHEFSSFVINACYFDKGFFMRFNDSIFLYKENRLIFYEHEKSRPGSSSYFPTYFNTRQDTSSKRVELQMPAHIITTTSHHAAVIYQSTIDGAWSIDTNLNKLDMHFLPGQQVSRTLVDNEQNVWFATLKDGIYKLPSAEMRTINFIRPQNQSNSEVYTIIPFRKSVVAGLGSSKVGIIKDRSLDRIQDYSTVTKKSSNPLSTNRLYCSFADDEGSAYLGFDAFLAKMESGKTIFSNIIAIKGIENVDANHIVLATSANALKLRKRDLEVVDTIWIGRCTEVFFQQGKYLVGTMNGLYEVDQNRNKKSLADIHPAFKRKVSDIKADNTGNLFIATVDMGVVIYHNGKVVKWLTEDNGLTSNICKTVFIDSSFAWIGTSAGISKIDLTNYDNIVKYGSSDGLPSDNINDILIVDSTVWVGTPAGLTFFNESRVMSTSQCHLVLEVKTEGKMISPSHYELSYKAPQIQFDFVGISYKSGGDIMYRYRVLELDTMWNQTRLTSISFASLPAGDYTFQIVAVNKFGIKSRLQTVHFSISQSFWKSWWFYASIVLGTILITAWLVNRRNRTLKTHLLEEYRLQRQFSELEQQALQAQMNPGFIFNSLHSIQQYIYKNEKRKANQFLTGFAYLIRQTLDMSGKEKISLSEEIQYLRSFLEMENMKLDDNLTYSIELDDDSRSDLNEIPPLILQPYLEMVLRNALGKKTNEMPWIELCFSVENEMIICSIKDKSKYSDKEAISFNNELEDYPLNAVLLAKKRIDLLNELRHTTIEVNVINGKGDNGDATNDVIIKIPTTIYAEPNSKYYY